ncbi:MAG: hypothetical protein ISS62_09885 [Desulfobacteraceae bacterium]|nr:hypothetical protein [Desulfobacteraceae bacterium]
MSKSSQNGSSTTTATSSPKMEKFSRTIHLDEIVLLGLLLLSGAGIALTDFAPSKGFWYWVAMAPLFWGGSIFMEWSRVKQRGESRFKIIRRQIIHWVGYLVAVHLVFLLNYTGRMNSADAGLVALLVLAVSTFFAGVYSDWRIIFVSIFLGSAVAGAALVEEFIWLALIPVVVIIVAAIVWWHYRKKHPRNK